MIQKAFFPFFSRPPTLAVGPPGCSVRPSRAREPKEPVRKNHIKKPLNAFMLYMKEMRPKIVAECTLKESAAINQILGRRVGIRMKCKHDIESRVYISNWMFLSSGIAWTARSKPSTTSRPARRGRFTCRCIQAGQLGTIMLRTKRSRGKLGTNVQSDHLLQKHMPPVRPTTSKKVLMQYI